MAFQAGDPDRGGANWTKDTDPADWMRYSVVWYSQRITHAIGAESLARHTRDYAYGNADFSGDPGFDNGLKRAWIASSLRLSPTRGSKLRLCEWMGLVCRLGTDGRPNTGLRQADTSKRTHRQFTRQSDQVCYAHGLVRAGGMTLAASSDLRIFPPRTPSSTSAGLAPDCPDTSRRHQDAPLRRADHRTRG